MSIRSCWLIVVLSSVFLLIFFLVILSVERSMLKSQLTVGLAASPFCPHFVLQCLVLVHASSGLRRLLGYLNHYVILLLPLYHM